MMLSIKCNRKKNSLETIAIKKIKNFNIFFTVIKVWLIVIGIVFLLLVILTQDCRFSWAVFCFVSFVLDANFLDQYYFLYNSAFVVWYACDFFTFRKSIFGPLSSSTLCVPDNVRLLRNVRDCLPLLTVSDTR